MKKIQEHAIDLKGKKCTSCEKGIYKETTQLDDLEGVLHCDKCTKKVERYLNNSQLKNECLRLCDIAIKLNNIP